MVHCEFSTDTTAHPKSVIMTSKEIQIILRLFLVIAMYCQASSSQFNQSLNLPHCKLAEKEA